MALSDVLNNLSGARDSLVAAINEKGGSLAATATLRQCAEAVANLPEGGGGEGAGILPGQIFHASFAEDSEYAESGQIMTKIGTPQFVVEDGVSCVNLQNVVFQVDYPIFSNGHPFTISYWGKRPEQESTRNPCVLGQGVFSSYGAVSIVHVSSGFNASNTQYWTECPVADPTIFHHYVVTYDSRYKMFVDGEQLAESETEFTLNIKSKPTLIGTDDGDDVSARGAIFYLANLKIFARVLSSEEIAQLYGEFLNR